MRQREPRHRAGNADREGRIARFPRVGVALLVEEDVARGRLRGGLAVVDGDVPAGAGEVDHHVAAAADIAGARIGDGERKAGRDRGVDRVAALLQHLDADAGGARLLRHHHAVARGRLRRGGRRRRGAQGGEQDEKGEAARRPPQSGDNLQVHARPLERVGRLSYACTL